MIEEIVYAAIDLKDNPEERRKAAFNLLVNDPKRPDDYEVTDQDVASAIQLLDSVALAVDMKIMSPKTAAKFVIDSMIDCEKSL